jgi:hypothetical protein
MATSKQKAVTRTKARASRQPQELDSVYFLKLVLYIIIGAQWLKLTNAAGTWQIPIPLGLFIGIIFARHDHFQLDRKIEYAVLLVAMLIGFWAQIGLVANV